MSPDEKQVKVEGVESAEAAQRPGPLKSNESEVGRQMSFVRHEINNALATLVSNFDYVKEEMKGHGVDLGEEVKAALEDMGKAIERLKGVAKMDASEIDKKISHFKNGSSEKRTPLKEGTIEKDGNRIVFVIDDELPITTALKRIVLGACDNGKKPKVEIFPSALEAKKAIESGTLPDFTLCDFRMPGMTGYAYYGWLKETHPDQIDKILFVSGENIESFEDPSIDPNIRDIQKREIFLQKPFRNEEVVSRVKKALGGK